MKIDYPSIADTLEHTHSHTVPHGQGIDTIQQIAKYETFKKMADRLGLTIEPMPQSHPLYKKIADEFKADTKRRLKVAKFTPIVEVIKLPKVDPKDKALYISIVRNTPTLWDIGDSRKTRKDAYCLITFAGLHQPQKKISSKAMRIVSKFLKRKTFRVHRVDIAIDTHDNRPIEKEGLKAFRACFNGFGSCRATHYHNSYYLEDIRELNHMRINYYDKWIKAIERKEKVSIAWRGWKRLEVTIMFDVTKSYNKGFIHYIESLEFINDLYDIDEVSTKAKIKSYDNDYLIYQLNSLIDNRVMNNQESKEQFNSVQSLERFKSSDFRRYLLPI